MKIIPQTPHMPVLRTDFSDDAMWQIVCNAMAKSYHDLTLKYGVGLSDVTLDFISDPEYSGITPEQVLALITIEDFWHSCIFIVDHTTISESEHPMLAMNLSELFFEDGDEDEETYNEQEHTFCLLPSEVAAMEINLTLGNMDFEDFSTSVKTDGIFRGF